MWTFILINILILEIAWIDSQALPGVSNLVASLGHTESRVVLGHTLNTQTLTKTDEQKKVLSKFMILCRAIFIAILGHMQWVGHPCEQNIYMTHDPTIPRLTDMSTYCFQKAHISIVTLALFKKAKQLNS